MLGPDRDGFCERVELAQFRSSSIFLEMLLCLNGSSLEAETFTECYPQLVHSELKKKLKSVQNIQHCKVEDWKRGALCNRMELVWGESVTQSHDGNNTKL